MEEACMKSRMSQTFQLNVEKRFFDIDENSNFSYPKFNFASMYWPPFVDVMSDNNTQSTEIVGPFMALLYEISKRLKFGYVKDF